MEMASPGWMLGGAGKGRRRDAAPRAATPPQLQASAWSGAKRLDGTPLLRSEL